MRNAFVLLAIFLFAGSTWAARNTKGIHTFDAEAAKAAVDERRIEDKIPGITWAVFSMDDMLFSGASGVGTEAHGDDPEIPANAKTSIYRIASSSKPFTAAAMYLTEQKAQYILGKKLSSLSKKKVGFKFGTDWLPRTAHHLMIHQSGISKDIPGTNMFWDMASIKDGKLPSIEDLKKGLDEVEFLFSPLQIPPGPHSLKYSNLGFNLLARIAAGYAKDETGAPLGLTFPELVQQRIFDRLEMKNSIYNTIPDSKHAKQMVTAYAAKGTSQDPESVSTRAPQPKVYDVGAYDGSIGIATSATDLAKFGQEILRWAYTEESKIGLEKTRGRWMLEPKTRFNQGMVFGEGTLWQKLKLDKHPDQVPPNAEEEEKKEDVYMVGHIGTGYGERSIIYVSPERNLGIALLFNTRDANRNEYIGRILNQVWTSKKYEEFEFLNPLNTKWLGETLASVKKHMEETKKGPGKVKTDPNPANWPEDLAEFTGKYRSTVEGIKEVGISEPDDEGNRKLVFLHNALTDEGEVEIETESGKKVARQFRFPDQGFLSVYFATEPVRFYKEDGVMKMQAAQAKYMTWEAPLDPPAEGQAPQE